MNQVNCVCEKCEYFSLGFFHQFSNCLEATSRAIAVFKTIRIEHDEKILFIIRICTAGDTAAATAPDQ